VGIEVRPLARLRSRETAQDSALRIDLQDAPGYGVAHIKDVVRRDDKAKGMPKAPLPQEPTISVEDLDACILTVAYVDEVTINHDRMGSVELSRPGTFHSPTKQRSAILVELQHPRIPVAICNVNVAISVPGNIGGLIEMQYIISRNPHSPQRKQHAPFRAKLQNHMRTDIGGPDIVLGIDANHVRCYEQLVGNAAEEFAGRVEFHEWVFAAMKNVNVPF